MENKPKRKRIEKSDKYNNSHLTNKFEGGFIENLASNHAKLESTHQYNIIVDYWIDKHYVDRINFPDDSGTQRLGIEKNIVEEIIKKAFEHLLYYSSRNEKLKFVNFPPKSNRPNRVLIKYITSEEEDLNIAVEYNSIDLYRYEVTVFTAKRQYEFRFGDGQYCVQFEGDSSYLVVNKNKEEVLIDECH